ncbi:MAG: hypothetical protein L3I99_02260 [Sulfurimonas sp.]|nr:hypothetical protein [Sulfurimonas sp.]
MKNASQIINIIQNKPQFSKLSKVQCIKKIQSLLILPIQKMISFAYFKGNTLFFVFNHPAGKQEFDNNIQNIKNALNFHTPSECDGIIIEDIKAFVTHSPKKPPLKMPITEDIYPERASGNFKIDIQDEKLNLLVKSIRDIIKASNDTN